MIGANCTIEVGGRRVRGRVYPWGVVEGRPLPSWFNSLPDVSDSIADVFAGPFTDSDLLKIDLQAATAECCTVCECNQAEF